MYHSILASQKKQGVLRSPALSYESEKSVENLVANMVQEKLKVSIPDLGDGPSQSFQSCQSEALSKNTNEDSNMMWLGSRSESTTSILGLDSGSGSMGLDGGYGTKENGAIESDKTDISKAASNIQPIKEAQIEDDADCSSSCVEESDNSGDTPDEDKTADTCESTDVNGDSMQVKEGASQRSLEDEDAPEPSFIRKVSAFGAMKRSFNSRSGQSNLNPANLTVHGEGRRQVLTAIFTKGIRSSNNIARGVAPIARRAVQAMDRKRAQTLINSEEGDGEKALDESHNFCDEGWKNREKMGSFEERDFMAKESEEEECIEAIRLLLVQNSVALGKLTPETAVKALGSKNNVPYPEDSSGQPKSGDDFDSGNIDSRLTGCGTVSEAVRSALQLWKEGHVSNAELLDLVHKDVQFNRLALPGAENESKLKEDSAFWGRFAFGERWAEKKARIQASSVFGSLKGWDLTGLIVKSNDDLRQEAFAMQLISLAAEAFDIAGLELWIKPYRILATGRTTGMIELVCNGMSFDSLKKRPGYSEGGLLGHFKKMSECAADPTEALKTSKKNFVRSLAAYSLLSYLFLFKDRHNGNLLLDTAGHVIHVSTARHTLETECVEKNLTSFIAFSFFILD